MDHELWYRGSGIKDELLHVEGDLHPPFRGDSSSQMVGRGWVECGSSV